MQTTLSIYNAAIKASSFQLATDFLNSILAYYTAQFQLLYGKSAISSVTLISANTTGNIVIIKFRITFVDKTTITTSSQRTAVAVNIQSTYNLIITKYFASISQSMNVNGNVALSAPKDVSTTVKKAIVSVVSATGNNQSKSITSTSSSSSITVSKSSTAGKSII
jgi:hypothetical protein